MAMKSRSSTSFTAVVARMDCVPMMFMCSLIPSITLLFEYSASSRSPALAIARRSSCTCEGPGITLMSLPEGRSTRENSA